MEHLEEFRSELSLSFIRSYILVDSELRIWLVTAEQLLLGGRPGSMQGRKSNSCTGLILFSILHHGWHTADFEVNDHACLLNLHL